MRDVARDPAALELLRVQRGRLADRMRPPWWYLTGVAIVWALVFAGPFGSRYLPRGVSPWPHLCRRIGGGLPAAVGPDPGHRHKDGLPEPPLSRPGRPAGIAMLVVSLAAIGTEHFLIHRGLLVAAIVVAALAVAAEVAAQQALLRAIRQDLRGGGGAA